MDLSLPLSQVPREFLPNSGRWGRKRDRTWEEGEGGTNQSTCVCQAPCDLFHLQSPPADTVTVPSRGSQDQRG